MASDWRTLAAGRVLDALVAERVMGWTGIRQQQVQMAEPGGGVAPRPCWVGNPPDGSSPAPLVRHVRPYSTDIAAAWEVADRVASSGLIWSLRRLNLRMAPSSLMPALSELITSQLTHALVRISF